MKQTSIIIPAWNEEKVLKKTLENLFKIDYENYEVIIVAGGKDKTLEIAKEFSIKCKNCKVLEQGLGGKNSALQKGISEINSESEVIVLLDADTIVDKNWIKEGIKKLEEYDAVNADYFPIKTNAISSFFMFEKILSRINKNSGLYGGGTIFLKRKVINENNLDSLFDKTVYIGIDFNLFKKLKEKNYKIGFSENSKVKTSLPSSFKQFIKQELRWLKAWSRLSKDSIINSIKSSLIILSSFLFLYLLIKKEIIISLISGILFFIYSIKTARNGLKVYREKKDKIFLKYLLSYIFLNYVYCFLRVYSLFSKNKLIHFKGERPK